MNRDGNSLSVAALGVHYHHTRVGGEVAGAHCIGLNKVGMPGSLIGIDVNSRGPDGSVLGEWPGPHGPATRMT